jgi:HSP20 family protein
METQIQSSNAPRQDLPVKEKQGTPETGTHQGRYFQPSVDIYETDEALVVTADIPGVEPQDVETDLRDNLLTLTARLKPLDARYQPLHREYEVGHYLRQFRLGQQIDQSRISAELKDGVLKLVLPKAEHAKARKIEVKAL